MSLVLLAIFLIWVFTLLADQKQVEGPHHSSIDKTLDNLNSGEEVNISQENVSENLNDPKLFSKKKINNWAYFDMIINTMKTIDIDIIVTYFLFVGLLFIDALWEVFNLLSLTNTTKKANASQNLLDLQTRNLLKNKTEIELKALLEDVDLISSMGQKELIECVLKSPAALHLLKLQEKKAQLKLMKNQELRDLLKGVDKVSRMKKSELVELVISLEKSESQNINK